ncbi:tricarballylate dehydrogenase [Salinivirga cyanobacteriivorans]|uniref:Tricarballylate dehydrogenase n=1 Tax=Salinivirga cyanobacteriivorans TaxID=1307839 RepID=A0A0S2HX18_9BACT|nr:NAD(P)/FAD-dependent oxidoreductase [Salinivirga cyanobacteriivorans]ALO14587.1 tricarballylate dehydrogenase [Salinivirga cyanobacteriivorans]
MKQFDVIVIGAGAAGLMAAGRAAEKGARVLVLEKMKREGRKLLITGKGRCNITNDLAVSEFIKHVYPNGRFLRNAFNRFYSQDVLQLLEQYGVETVLERGGRYYPKSQKAADVVRALKKWIDELGVEVRFGQQVYELLLENNAIKGVRCNQERFDCEKIIIATGGKSYPATGSTGDGYCLAEAVGHTIENIRPALVPLTVESKVPGKLESLNLRNINAILWIDGKKAAEQFGEMTFISRGLDGPVILTLSRAAVDALNHKRKVVVTIDLKPALDEKKLDNRFLRDLDANGKKKFRNVFSDWLPAALVPVFMEELKLDGEKECSQVSASERKAIRKLFKNWTFKITGHRPWEEAIVTAGGVATSEVSPKTMESKLIAGLHFAGEVLDLDAETGGFNLQIAWSTGWVAGDAVK